MEVEMLPMAAAMGFGITIYRPLAIGVLTGKYLEAKPGEIGGAELADGARRLRPGLRILFTSGFTQIRSPPPEDGWRRANLVTKPYTTVELATRLRQALNGSERFNARPTGAAP